MSEKRFGNIEFTGKDVAIPATPFDRIATSGRGELLLVSVVAPTQTIKQIRAILHGGTKVKIVAGGVRVQQPSTGRTRHTSRATSGHRPMAI